MTEHPEPELDPLLDFDLSDALMDGPVDMTPTILRRFAWDTTPCGDVPELLTGLGLTHGTPEGMAIDHVASHERLRTVFPLEGQLQAYSAVLGAVITKAILGGGEDEDDEMCDEHEAAFANQNAEVILSGVRAVIAQLMYSGVLCYGPAAGTFQVAIVDSEEGTGE